MRRLQIAVGVLRDVQKKRHSAGSVPHVHEQQGREHGKAEERQSQRRLDQVIFSILLGAMLTANAEDPCRSEGT